MNKIILIFLLIFFTHGCKTLKKSLGLEKDVPDEFLIKKIDPIEKPPNFELIPPNSKIKKSSNFTYINRLYIIRIVLIFNKINSIKLSN